MKKIKILSTLLAFVLMLGAVAVSFSSCSGGDTVIMSISDGEITKEMKLSTYKFLLSRMKGTLEYYDYDVDSDSFWRTIISSDGKTWDDHFSSTIFEQTKLYLTIEYLFDKEGLTLDESREEKIEKTMSGLVTASGSLTALNSELKNYGVNYDMLRDIYVTEQKFSQLLAYYYGESGEKIDKSVKDQFYKDNYVAFGQIFLPIYEVVTGSDGKEQASFFDDEKKEEMLDLAKKYSSECDGRLDRFYEYCELYSELEDSDEPTYLFVQSEYYGLQDQSSAYLDTVAEELSSMAVGECKVIASPFGYHVICRYAREDGAYENEKYKESFSDFFAMLSDKLFDEKCAFYAENITVYEDVERPRISSVKSNKLY